MNLGIVEIILLILTLGMSMMINYLVIDLSNKKGIFLDNISKIQQVHHHPIPRIGGLGIFLACMFMGYFSPIGMFLMIASIPAFLSGFLEDYSNNVAPMQRLAIMLLAPFIGCFLVPESALIHWNNYEMYKYLGIGFTILFTTTLVNGINFIDGQNGLASGVGILTLAGIAIIAYQVNQIELAYIGITAMMAIIGFIIFNFPKAKILLGDGGAYFIGFLIGALSIYLTQHHYSNVSIITGFALCMFPIWEVTFSVIRKVLFDKISPMQSDKYHLHQLMYRNIGYYNNTIPALIILPIWAIFIGMITIYFDNTLALFIICASFIAIYTSGYYILRVADIKRRIKHINKNNHTIS